MPRAALGWGRRRGPLPDPRQAGPAAQLWGPGRQTSPAVSSLRACPTWRASVPRSRPHPCWQWGLNKAGAARPQTLRWPCSPEPSALLAKALPDQHGSVSALHVLARVCVLFFSQTSILGERLVHQDPSASVSSLETGSTPCH